MTLPQNLSIVITTVDTQERARELARGLLESRLAACAQIDGPIESHFRWNQAIECSTEYRVTIKTLPIALAAVKQWILENHPYTTPQIIMLSGQGSDAYQQWLTQEITAGR